MALHGCTHTFEELALDVFPRLLSELRQAIPTARLLTDVLTQPSLFPGEAGCYVVIRNGQAIYVGIAKNIRSRLKQHLTAGPSGANLAVRMAAKSLALKVHKVKLHADFQSAFEEAKQQLANCNVAFIKIANPLEMYLFEPFCAMAFDTHEFNYFDTLQILSPRASSIKEQQA